MSEFAVIIYIEKLFWGFSMKLCDKCNLVTEDKLTFCPHCGKKLEIIPLCVAKFLCPDAFNKKIKKDGDDTARPRKTNDDSI